MKEFENMYICTDRPTIHRHDIRTDTDRRTLCDGIGRAMYSVSRQQSYRPRSQLKVPSYRSRTNFGSSQNLRNELHELADTSLLFSSLLFSSGQTAVKLSGAEAADRPNALPLINQKPNDKGEWLYPP